LAILDLWGIKIAYYQKPLLLLYIILVLCKGGWCLAVVIFRSQPNSIFKPDGAKNFAVEEESRMFYTLLIP
jgi:hypothetical protein